jgi:methoxymalonate biosynthesis protein
VPEAPKPVKCLVWDLDNTLWQGTLLEDAQVRLPDGIRKTIAALDARGILQSISSRNDHDLAWGRLVEWGLADYFVLPKIHWGRKSDAVREIAAELNFAHSAMAFIDDQPAERAEVAFHLPEVRCLPADQALSLTNLPEFSPTTVTTDSARRRQMYQAGFRRAAEQDLFAGPHEDFLRSLELELEITRATGAELARVEELTLRTSQMNATGIAYDGSLLRELQNDPGHEVLICTLTDRFGPHGAVGVVLLATGKSTWRLKLLATSCRVVSFGTGTVILNWLVDSAARAGVHLNADYRPTERNRIMEVAYRFAGFTDDSCSCEPASAVREPGVQRLHLVPARRATPEAIQLIAPDLTPRVAH